jgi:hypothetical protein
MAFTEWLALKWFDFSQTLAILGGLFVALYTIRTDRNSRMVANLFEATKLTFGSRTDLNQIFDDDRSKPTQSESTFITLLILHLKAVYHSRKNCVPIQLDGIRADIRNFLSYKIPRIVWDERKVYYDADFVRFVEDILGSK